MKTRWVLGGVIAFGVLLAGYAGCAASLNGTTVYIENCTPDLCTQRATDECGSGASGQCEGNDCRLSCPSSCASREIGRVTAM